MHWAVRTGIGIQANRRVHAVGKGDMTKDLAAANEELLPILNGCAMGYAETDPSLTWYDSSGQAYNKNLLFGLVHFTNECK